MSHRVAMFLVLLALGANAEAQTGTGAITGAVVDAVTNRPVAGAVVTLEEPRPGSQIRLRTYKQIKTEKGRFAFIELRAAETYFI